MDAPTTRSLTTSLRTRPVAVRAAGLPSPLWDCAPSPQGRHQNRGSLAAAW